MVDNCLSLSLSLSTDEIRQDIEDAVRRMKPWSSETDDTLFGGWARMAQPIDGFSVVEVSLTASSE